jgi:hypothetical protein
MNCFIFEWTRILIFNECDDWPPAWVSRVRTRWDCMSPYECINDDGSHLESESQIIPADESFESAGTCHYFPQCVSVVRAFGPQRQHSEMVSNQCARCVVHAEYLSNVLSTTHVHTAWTLGAHFTHKGARLSLQRERDWIALTHFPPPWGHTPRTACACSSDSVWTNVKPRGRSGRHSTCPQATTPVVGGSVLVTLLGECALIRGTLPLTSIIKGWQLFLIIILKSLYILFINNY